VRKLTKSHPPICRTSWPRARTVRRAKHPKQETRIVLLSRRIPKRARAVGLAGNPTTPTHTLCRGELYLGSVLAVTKHSLNLSLNSRDNLILSAGSQGCLCVVATRMERQFESAKSNRRSFRFAALSVRMTAPWDSEGCAQSRDFLFAGPPDNTLQIDRVRVLGRKLNWRIS
jgi:hypothetical protein